MELAQGDILGGKYRVERVLGRGGMGVVFAATHLELDELVAIKVLHGDGVDAVGMERFKREARAAVRLKSQHVARVLDVDRLADGGRYMVLEYLEGKDLLKVVREHGRLPIADAASYILQACEGLAEAHALGMVHRDIKLQNLFLTRRADGGPLIKVLDFGLVKVRGGQLGEIEASLTEPSTIIGSLAYMAPEQLRTTTEVDARADVWGLGVCLYYLISGALPFEEEHLGALYAAIGGRHPVRLDVVDPAIPTAVADLVERTLEKNVTRRFQDVRELAEALEPFGRDAETVVGIAWRISHVLNPRRPATPSLTLTDDEAPTAPRSAPDAGGPPVTQTAPMDRKVETTLALEGIVSGMAPIANEAVSATVESPPRASWRLGFIAVAIGALLAGFVGTSGLFRGEPAQPVAAPPQVVASPIAPVALPEVAPSGSPAASATAPIAASDAAPARAGTRSPHARPAAPPAKTTGQKAPSAYDQY